MGTHSFYFNSSLSNVSKTANTDQVVHTDHANKVEPNKQPYNKWKIATIVCVSTVAVAAAGFAYYSYTRSGSILDSDTETKFKSTINELTEKVSFYKKSLEESTSTNFNQQGQIEDLQKNKGILTSKIDDLSGKISSLETSESSLLSTNTALNKQVIDLKITDSNSQSLIQTLKTKAESLLNIKENLLSKINSLELKNEDLLKNEEHQKSVISKLNNDIKLHQIKENNLQEALVFVNRNVPAPTTEPSSFQLLGSAAKLVVIGFSIMWGVNHMG